MEPNSDQGWEGLGHSLSLVLFILERGNPARGAGQFTEHGRCLVPSPGAHPLGLLATWFLCSALLGAVVTVQDFH